MRGFSLLIVLVFLHLISILALQILAANMSVARMLRDEYSAWSAEYHANSLMAQVERIDSDCVLDDVLIERITEYPIEWWKTWACYGKSDRYDYFYFKELLFVDNYRSRNNQYKHGDADRYYRNTLLQISRLSVKYDVLLQSVTKLSSPNKGNDGHVRLCLWRLA